MSRWGSLEIKYFFKPEQFSRGLEVECSFQKKVTYKKKQETYEPVWGSLGPFDPDWVFNLLRADSKNYCKQQKKIIGKEYLSTCEPVWTRLSQIAFFTGWIKFQKNTGPTEAKGKRNDIVINLKAFVAFSNILRTFDPDWIFNLLNAVSQKNGK